MSDGLGSKVLGAIALHSMCPRESPLPTFFGIRRRRGPGGAKFPEPQSTAGWTLVCRPSRRGVEGPGLEAATAAVTRVTRRVEVHPVTRGVREALGLQQLDHRDLLGNVLRRVRPHAGLADVEPCKVLLEQVGPHPSDFEGRAAGPLRGQLDLVVAVVGVVGQVSDVGDVDDVLDGQALPPQHARQQIGEHVRTQVAEVLAAVNRRAAAVDAGHARSAGAEGLDATAEGVVEFELGHDHRLSFRNERQRGDRPPTVWDGTSKLGLRRVESGRPKTATTRDAERDFQHLRQSLAHLTRVIGDGHAVARTPSCFSPVPPPIPTARARRPPPDWNPREVRRCTICPYFQLIDRARSVNLALTPKTRMRLLPSEREDRPACP